MPNRLKRLTANDVVTVIARIVHNDGRAQMLAAELGAAPHLWRALRVEGKVVEQVGTGRWRVSFEDGEAVHVLTLARVHLDFKKRPEAARGKAPSGAAAPPAGTSTDDGQDSDDAQSVCSEAPAEVMGSVPEEDDPAPLPAPNKQSGCVTTMLTCLSGPRTRSTARMARPCPGWDSGPMAAGHAMHDENPRQGRAQGRDPDAAVRFERLVWP